jgi:hypothetical protein
LPAPARPGDGVALELLPARHGVYRLAPDAPLPAWAEGDGGGVSATLRSARELSVLCPEPGGGSPPGAIEASEGWRALRVAGRLDHAMVGVLSGLAAPLAAARVPIFAVSSFETDYLLVPAARLGEALEALRDAGHSVPG